jgi:hypothetical protein
VAGEQPCRKAARAKKRTVCFMESSILSLIPKSTEFLAETLYSKKKIHAQDSKELREKQTVQQGAARNPENELH